MNLKSKAFTLVEILLVASLTALLSVAILKSFSNGLKLWTKVQRIHRESEVIIFEDKISEDLRSVVSISGIDFKGAQYELSFPAIVRIKIDPKSSRSMEGVADQIGAIQYRYDNSQHSLFRQHANYGQALKNKWVEEGVLVLSGITQLSFRYQVSSDKGSIIKSEVSGQIPIGVFVDIQFVDDSGEHKFSQFISIPIGG